MKKAAVPLILVAVVLLALGVMTEAQQTTKIPRLGYYTLPFLPLARPEPRPSVRVCANLGTWKEKIL